MANDPNRDILPVKESFDRGKFTLATISGLLWVCFLVTGNFIFQRAATESSLTLFQDTGGQTSKISLLNFMRKILN